MAQKWEFSFPCHSPAIQVLLCLLLYFFYFLYIKMWMVKRIIKPLSLGEIANEKRAWERAS